MFWRYYQAPGAVSATSPRLSAPLLRGLPTAAIRPLFLLCLLAHLTSDNAITSRTADGSKNGATYKTSDRRHTCFGGGTETRSGYGHRAGKPRPSSGLQGGPVLCSVIAGFHQLPYPWFLHSMSRLDDNAVGTAITMRITIKEQIAAQQFSAAYQTLDDLMHFIDGRSGNIQAIGPLDVDLNPRNTILLQRPTSSSWTSQWGSDTASWKIPARWRRPTCRRPWT